MCGICGKISHGSGPVEKSLINSMCSSFAHRGPDDRGTYTNNAVSGNTSQVHVGLGHQRLSIIDLSAAGHQPMPNENGSVWLAFNGEIYNYKEIRLELQKKGHVFRSDTDTEILIHLYEEEGLSAIHKLSGMFSFAIWDNGLNRLWVGRDRIGIKPLVYFWDGTHFVFGSEIKALLADPNIPKEIDYAALYLYLTFNYIPAPLTIFKDIKKLEPGHYLAIENKNLKIVKYWDAPRKIDSTIKNLSFNDQEKQYKENLYQLLDQSVQARMIADVPLGAFLSGGIDSSIIVALMSRHADNSLKTFSIGYKDDDVYDETSYAREVAKRYNTEHLEFKLSHKDMLKALPTIISSLDEPFADSSAIPTYIVSKETRKHVSVALSGDGGDELFAGYRSYLAEFWFAKYMMVPGIFRDGILENIINALPDSRDTKGLEYIRRIKKFLKGTKGSFPERVLALKEVFPQDVRQKILLESPNDASSNDPALKWVEKLLSFYQGDRLNSILFADLKDSLPGDMLTKVDWMSMKNSLEVRVPFLDHRVVELAFQMPGSLKLKQGKTKYILKETFKDLLPPSVYRRPKAGFEVPISRWLKNELKFLIDEYLARERIQNQGIFDYKIVKGLIGQHLHGKTDTSWMLWNLIVFQSWYENYFR